MSCTVMFINTSELLIMLSTGLDVLASTKREKGDMGFKAPAPKKIMTFDSFDEDEKCDPSGIEESRDDSLRGLRGRTSRQYRASFVEENSLQGQVPLLCEI